MAYNKLSGTVIAPDYFGPEPGKPPTGYVVGILSGTLLGDGANIKDVPRIIANASEDNLLTVGVNSNSLVGEPKLKFDGSANTPQLSVLGEMSCSYNVSASGFYGSAAGLTNLPPADGQGPVGSVQFMTNAGKISGSSELILQGRVLAVNGTLTLNRRLISTNETATVHDYIVGIDSANSNIAFQLLKADALSNGQILLIKDEGGNAETNNITINASGADNIDGQNSIVLESSYASIQLFCNGLNKYFIY